MANTKSHCRVTSAGVDATEAPSARRGSVFATLRLYTVTLAPVRTSRAAICAPMMPSPRNPTLGGVDIGACFVVGRRVTRARGRARPNTAPGTLDRAPPRREDAGRRESFTNSARRGVCRADRTHRVVPPSALGFDRNCRKHRDDADSTHRVSRDSAHTAGPPHARARASFERRVGHETLHQADDAVRCRDLGPTGRPRREARVKGARTTSRAAAVASARHRVSVRRGGGRVSRGHTRHSRRSSLRPRAVSRTSTPRALLSPRAVLDAQVAYLQREAIAGGYETTEEEAAALALPYAALASLLHCEASEIAITQSATSAWQCAFGALLESFQPGDRVLTAQCEYASNYIAYLQAARTRGVVVETVPSDAETGQLDVRALEARLELATDVPSATATVDGRAVGPVKLISITHVPTSGLGE